MTLRFADLARTYETFPREWVMRGSPGQKIVAGRAAHALAADMALSALVIDAVEPLDRFPERLLAALPRSRSEASLIVTDPDAAAAILKSPEILGELRRRLRYNLIFPMEGRTALRMTAVEGASMFETAVGLAWCWIEGPERCCRLTFHNFGPRQTVRLTFLPWFSAFAADVRSRRTAALIVADDEGRRRCRIRANETVETMLRLDRGSSTVRLATSLPAGSTGTDPRVISLGIVNPQVHSQGGELLIPVEAFRAQPLDLPFAAVRARLHRAGFYEVAGLLAAGAGILGPIAPTRGSPQIGVHAAADQLSAIEPAAGDGEVCWVIAGDKTRPEAA